MPRGIPNNPDASGFLIPVVAFVIFLLSQTCDFSDSDGNLKVQPTPTATPTATPTPLPKPVSPPSVSPSLAMPWEIDKVLRYRGEDVRFVLIWGAVNVLILFLFLLILLLLRQRQRVHMALAKYIPRVLKMSLGIDDGKTRAYRFNKAYSYAKSGEYEKAIEYFSKVIEIDPSNAEAYYERSECYEKLGEHQKAIADRAKIKELD